MIPNYDALYLAPHLDDVVLSCGGQIAQATAVGERVLIVTIMAGDPPNDELSAYAMRLHDRWALAHKAVAARRAEDEIAGARVGAEVWHGRVPDCIYRRDSATGEPFYTTDADLFGSVASVELASGGLRDEITAVLRALPSAKKIYAPFTVGNHVDHQLVRQAAEQAFGTSLIYYEDYPYVQWPGLLDTLLAQEAEAGRAWQAQLVRVSDTAVSTRCAAILAYASQISTFFTDETDLRAQVGNYVTAVGGERLWYSQPFSPTNNAA